MNQAQSTVAYHSALTRELLIRGHAGHDRKQRVAGGHVAEVLERAHGTTFIASDDRHIRAPLSMVERKRGPDAPFLAVANIRA